ncbi:MAG: hypothetical protein NC131_00955 [Roseburia sp.]|nr:hypothetical protein [Roseburia sp.]
MTDGKINLYETMNDKIADILAIEKDPTSLYASAYIKDLRAENARLKSEVDRLNCVVADRGQIIEEYEQELKRRK